MSTARGIAAQWTGVLAGPIAWAIDLGASYTLVKWACGRQHAIVLHLITVGALAIIAVGAFAAWRALAAVPDDAPTDGGGPLDRGRFMAIFGLTMCALFAAVVIAGAIPGWAIDPCL